MLLFDFNFRPGEKNISLSSKTVNNILSLFGKAFYYAKNCCSNFESCQNSFLSGLIFKMTMNRSNIFRNM